jgi:hypothetical protein
MKPINELDAVALTCNLPAHGLVRGDVGTAMLVHGNGVAFEVEFVGYDGHTVALVTLETRPSAPASDPRHSPRSRTGTRVSPAAFFVSQIRPGGDGVKVLLEFLAHSPKLGACNRQIFARLLLITSASRPNRWTSSAISRGCMN